MLKILGDKVKIGSKPQTVDGKIIYASVTGMLVRSNDNIIACDLVGNILAIFFKAANDHYCESIHDDKPGFVWNSSTSQSCAFSFIAKVEQWLLSKWQITQTNKYEIKCSSDNETIIIPILQSINALRMSIAGDLLIIGTSRCIHMYSISTQKLKHMIYGDFSHEFYICLHDAEFALIEARGNDIYRII